MIRTEIPSSSNGNSVEEMPPPTPTKPAQVEKAKSQQRSQFDLRSHPNGDQALPEPKVTSVKIKNPPGGRSSGAIRCRSFPLIKRRHRHLQKTSI